MGEFLCYIKTISIFYFTVKFATRKSLSYINSNTIAQEYSDYLSVIKCAQLLHLYYPSIWRQADEWWGPSMRINVSGITDVIRFWIMNIPFGRVPTAISQKCVVGVINLTKLKERWKRKLCRSASRRITGLRDYLPRHEFWRAQIQKQHVFGKPSTSSITWRD